MKRNTIYIVDLESIPTRYTCEWKTYIPELLEKEASSYNIKVVEGGEATGTNAGAFLDFAKTNIYKNNQINKIAEKFSKQEIKDGDKFLFTDAWHPGVTQIRYMQDLTMPPESNIEIHGLWHAGSYDSNDILGMRIKNKNWSHSLERAMYHAYDYNWFATDYHLNFFNRHLMAPKGEYRTKSHRTGWPMSYVKHNLSKYNNTEKENLILFPHRISDDKQPDIFDDMAKDLEKHGYRCIKNQELNLSKSQYHELLGKTKAVFSCSLHEMLGISCYEGAVCGALPLVPDRLSYMELYSDNLKYPNEWTLDFDTYKTHKEELLNFVINALDNYDENKQRLGGVVDRLHEKYFSADNMINIISKE